MTILMNCVVDLWLNDFSFQYECICRKFPLQYSTEQTLIGLTRSMQVQLQLRPLMQDLFHCPGVNPYLTFMWSCARIVAMLSVVLKRTCLIIS